MPGTVRGAGPPVWWGEVMKRLRDRWADLGPRVTSAVVMIAVGLGAILAHPLAFAALVAVVAVVGLWELFQMGRAKSATGVFSFADFFALSGYAFMLCLGALGLLSLRMVYGISGLLFVVTLVVLTDTGGYFAGRALGGRKFWPAISPKKTWAGVIAGWGAVAVFAGVIGPDFAAHPIRIGWGGFVLGAVALSFASQLGDIMESALKRRMGVKDSSNLIPGHGGVLDRFDALLAVGALCLAALVLPAYLAASAG